jgi:hypothetical protein
LLTGPVHLAIARRGTIIATTRTAFWKRDTSPFLALFGESIDARDPELEVLVIASPPGAPLALERPTATRGRLDDCFTVQP